MGKQATAAMAFACGHEGPEAVDGCRPSLQFTPDASEQQTSRRRSVMCGGYGA